MNEDEITPIPVRIDNIDTLRSLLGTVVTPVAEITPDDCECRTISNFSTTFQDNSRMPQGVAELLSYDPLRITASIITWDQPVVICDNRNSASDTQNQVTSVPNPQGAYLGAQVGIAIPSTKQMWVAATSSSPTRISIVITRRRST